MVIKTSSHFLKNFSSKKKSEGIVPNMLNSNFFFSHLSKKKGQLCKQKKNGKDAMKRKKCPLEKATEKRKKSQVVSFDSGREVRVYVITRLKRSPGSEKAAKEVEK
ncbi:hypothetical protein RFI_25363, partial [Reticulomyxa filosa]